MTHVFKVMKSAVIEILELVYVEATIATVKMTDHISSILVDVNIT